MSLITSQKFNNSRRSYSSLGGAHLSKKRPEKRLRKITMKHSGRNFSGKLTTRHRGGQQKRYLRRIDWRRDKRDIPAKVISIEYDPNRSADIALLLYKDGEHRYILSPQGTKIGDVLDAGKSADIRPGNNLPLSHIPIGVAIHNLELTPGKGGQLVRGAGTSAIIQSRDNRYASVLLPSRELRLVPVTCYATVGQLGNLDWKNVTFGKAGRKRRLGIKPTVRGTAQHPDSHPHGGGEGRSGEGMPPKTPWGKPARGKRTRRPNRHSAKLIIKRRK